MVGYKVRVQQSNLGRRHVGAVGWQAGHSSQVWPTPSLLLPLPLHRCLVASNSGFSYTAQKWGRHSCYVNVQVSAQLVHLYLRR